ncbi:MAG: BtpA/SgcQ family protein [Actinobacteria bacterium]|nr:BtpA/SgcQ family protein [Actinomycetota bacterium]MCI0678109.1 BtpA/SgcQ family protein [Actinomycetota bacterium]
MTTIPRVVGMVHLLPLPGSPRHVSMGDVLGAAVEDADVLVDAGFGALLVENFGDSPFWADTVPPETVAAMTVAVETIRRSHPVAIGVNVLRNDVVSALAVAAATGAVFVRVNVLTGTMYTDQGPLVGRAAEVARRRAFLCPDVEIWADVMVKHATPPPETDVAQVAHDTVTRGLADAVIVTGGATGSTPDLERLNVVRVAVPAGTPVVVGSGADSSNLASFMTVADSVIVGSSLKHDGDPRNRVDRDRARRFIETATGLGLL